jgi:hypothetical protein
VKIPDINGRQYGFPYHDDAGQSSDISSAARSIWSSRSAGNHRDIGGRGGISRRAHTHPPTALSYTPCHYETVIFTLRIQHYRRRADLLPADFVPAAN